MGLGDFMRERKTISTGVLLTLSQKKRLGELAESTGRTPNFVVGELIERAQLLPVQTIAPVATLTVENAKSAVNPGKIQHGAFAQTL